MSIKVIVNGARGKMGTLASETISKHPDFNLSAKLSREDNLRQAIDTYRPQVVVDVTRADCVYNNALTIIESCVHPVIGTSGLVDTQIQHLQNLCREKQLGGIIAPNFSISAVLMMRYAANAARFLSDVAIIEAHHPQKFDAPSGTALKTAQMIANARPNLKEKPQSHELIEGVCGGQHQEVTIHSLRLPGILAQQQVIFGSPGETLTITHNSIDRSSFMPGIVLCCQKVLELRSLYYGLEKLLED